MNGKLSPGKAWRRMLPGIALTLLLLAGFAPPGIVTADEPPAPVHNITTGENFTSIQAAIDDSDTQNGHIIRVDSGNYTENVNVTKSVTIESTSGNPADTIVQAADANDHVIDVQADYVTIRGFTVYGATGTDKAGIYLEMYTDHATITGNRVGYDADHKNAIGIYLSSANDNTVSGNSASFNTKDGIYLMSSGAKNNDINHNTASSNGQYGIHLNTASSNYVGIDTANSNTLSGIFLEAGANNNLVIGNTSDSNVMYGVYIKDFISVFNNVWGNNLSSNNKGVYIEDAGDNAITANIITLNVVGIQFVSSGSKNNIISENTITGNSMAGIYPFAANNVIYSNDLNQPTNVISASNLKNKWSSKAEIYYKYSSSYFKSYLGNYYSDYLGADADNNGIGDTAYITNYGTSPPDEDPYPLKEGHFTYTPEVWYLSDHGMFKYNPQMAPTPEALNAGSSLMWRDNHALAIPGTFPLGSNFTLQLTFTSAPNAGDNFTVDVGYASNGSNFVSGGSTVTINGVGDFVTKTFIVSVNSGFTVPAGSNVAVRITNNSSSAYYIQTGGTWSFLAEPYLAANFAGTVTGVVFNDDNGNQIIDAGEAGLAGVTVLLKQGSTLLNNVVTGQDGTYSIFYPETINGSYTVIETDPSGYASTTPNEVAVNIIQNQQVTVNFGDVLPGSISGTVFEDADADGIRDAGESGLAGVAVTLRRDQSVTENTTTSANGAYTFPGLLPGAYSIETADPPGYVATTPNTVTANVTAGGLVTVNFGYELMPVGYNGPDWYASPDGNDTSGDGSQNAPFRTIGQAVQAASAEDTIYLTGAGSSDDFVENVHVTKPLTITSVSMAGVRAAGPNDHTFHVTASNVTISGLQIYAMYLPGQAGIYLDQVIGGVIQNNMFQSNYNAVVLYRGGDHQVTGNEFYPPNNWGIVLRGSVGNVIANNYFQGDALGDIHLDYVPSPPSGSDNNIVRDNELGEGSGRGIYLSYGANNEIAGNYIYFKPRSGIELDNSTGNIIHDNEITDIQGDDAMAILLLNSGGNTIRQNYLGNNDFGVGLSLSNGNTFYLNSFDWNSNEVVSADSSNNWRSPEQMPYRFGGGAIVTGFLGNFYGAYIGQDDGSGGRTTGDGVGDTDIPVATDGEGDSYPLMSYWEDYEFLEVVAGDASGDGVVDAVDITKVERIIAGLDPKKPGADANLDGKVNSLDITRVERLIAGLD